MTRAEAFEICASEALEKAASLYGLNDRVFESIDEHEGGRNIAYRVSGGLILRFSYLPDRSYEDILAEVEFIRYLHINGARVANARESIYGRLAEKILARGHEFICCLFDEARGDQIAAHGYRYRDNAPLSEYFYNCGATIGRIHALAKAYKPVHRRFDFFDVYSDSALDSLFPAEWETIKNDCKSIVRAVYGLEKTNDNYGLLHFDFSDGNYMIDYQNGDITVFDFDNAMYGFYMYDLANLWVHGSGWVMRERDSLKRRAFMRDYFAEIVRGYRSETDISDSELANLQLFIDAVTVENIVDNLMCARAEGEDPEIDEYVAFRADCLRNKKEFMGLFD